MTLLVIYIVLTVGISFLCSISEATILSLNMSHVNVIKKEKPNAGALLEELKNDMDISISSILIFNTIANTLGAAGIGAEAARMFGMDFVFYISVALTLLILFISEIIPKTIGAVYFKEIAPAVAYIIKTFVFLSYPLAKITLFVTRKISKGSTSHLVTREELLQTTFLVEDGGLIDEKESDVIENVLGLSKNRISEILTPRSVIFAVEENQSINELIKTAGIKKFSRIPVYSGSIDHIIGVVFSKQIYQVALENENKKLEDLMVPIFSINEKIPVSYALDMFIKRKEHMFLVTDSYDQTEGILTLEDCIETLLGIEIMDELDTTEDMRKLARDTMKKKKKDKKEKKEKKEQKEQIEHKEQNSI